MPLSQKLLATYVLNRTGMIASCEINSDPNFVIFRYKNTTDTDTAVDLIQKLLTPGIEDIVKIVNEIQVSVPLMEKKFLTDLKRLVISILEKEDHAKFDPVDFAENDYRFCEKINCRFTIPSIHLSICADIQNKFLRIGIRLQDENNKYSGLFKNKKEYRTKEILLGLASIDVITFTTALKALETPTLVFSPTTSATSTEASMFNLPPKNPRNKKQEEVRHTRKSSR
jgi:hypothetical protein